MITVTEDHGTQRNIESINILENRMLHNIITRSNFTTLKFISKMFHEYFH